MRAQWLMARFRVARWRRMMTVTRSYVTVRLSSTRRYTISVPHKLISVLASPDFPSTVCFFAQPQLWHTLINDRFSLTPQTNKTWRKLIFSAFQWYRGWVLGFLAGKEKEQKIIPAIVEKPFYLALTTTKSMVGQWNITLHCQSKRKWEPFLHGSSINPEELLR